MDNAKLSPKIKNEKLTALVGTRYMNEVDFSEPNRIVTKKKIVVPNPIAPIDIIKKFIQNIQLNEKTFNNNSHGAKINENKKAKE